MTVDHSSEITDPFEACSDPEVPLIIEHHILWSMSYSVPILLFNGWMSGMYVDELLVLRKN